MIPDDRYILLILDYVVDLIKLMYDPKIIDKSHRSVYVPTRQRANVQTRLMSNPKMCGTHIPWHTLLGDILI